MDKETLVISIIVVLCIGAAVVTYGITNNDNPVFSNLTNMGSNSAGNSAGNHSVATNNTTNLNSSSHGVNGSNGAGSGASTSDSSSSSNNGGSGSNGGSNSGSGSGEYSDWQEDYDTGAVDEDGNPIYRSVVSTSGGENPAGVYEYYWSAAGPISEERIG